MTTLNPLLLLASARSFIFLSATALAAPTELFNGRDLSSWMRGYLGLQNHAARAVIKFRNLRLAEL